MSSLLVIAAERRSTAVCMPSIRDGECSCSSEGSKKMRAASMSLIPRCTNRLPTIEGTERDSLSAAAELLSKLLRSQRIQGLYHKSKYEKRQRTSQAFGLSTHRRRCAPRLRFRCESYALRTPRQGPEGRRAFAMAVARAPAHRALGHSRVQPRREA